MATDREEFARIREALKKNPKGMNVIEIAAAIDMHRQSVTKYLEMLTVSGQVEVKTFGPSKVYYLSQRLPLSAMLSVSSDMILLVDRDLKIINVNDAFLACVSVTREYILNRGIGDVSFPLEFDPSITPYISDAIGGKEARIEANYKKKGKEHFFVVKFLPVVFDDGQPGATMILEDVTEKKRAEREREKIYGRLKESDQRFRILIQNLKQGVVLVEANGKFSIYNPAYLEIFGITDEEMENRNLKGREWNDLVVLDKDGKVLSHDERPSIKAFATGMPIKNMLVGIIRPLDGKLIWALASADPLKSPDGKVEKLICTYYDITERKRAEEALAEVNSQLELYLDLMDHDISNTQQIAIGQLELAREIIAESGKLGTEDMELIDSPVEALQRSARLIDNVRKLQLFNESGVRMDTIDLGKLLAEVVGEQTSITGDRPTIHYDPVSGCLVKANSLLKDAFTNLLGYAIKHSKSTRINISVDKAGQNGSSFYCVALEDFGPGIPDEKKGEVFHQYKRGYTKTKGPGIGQYIVKTLVEGFNGRVNVEDRVPGDYAKGVRFVVELPVAEEEHGI